MCGPTHKVELFPLTLLSLQSHTLEHCGHSVSQVLVDKQNYEPDPSEHSLLSQWPDNTSTGGRDRERQLSIRHKQLGSPTKLPHSTGQALIMTYIFSCTSQLYLVIIQCRKQPMTVLLIVLIRLTHKKICWDNETMR